MDISAKDLILKLYNAQVVAFGQFTLKSGIISPIYIDLRVVVSYPSLLKAIAAALWTCVSSLTFDLLCGVPYTALPIATAISLEHDIPLLLRRKEAKTYGTKKMIEGIFRPGQKCLVVEDVITSGASILETAEALCENGLKVTDAVVVLNREQGGKERLKESGISLHPLFNLSDFLSVLHQEKLIAEETFLNVKNFLQMR